MSWDRILRPEILALSIPVLAVAFWGLNSIIRAMRGDPDEFEQWQRELEQLRARVDELERANKAMQQR